MVSAEKYITEVLLMKTRLNKITAFLAGILCPIICTITTTAGAHCFDISDNISPKQNLFVSDRVKWSVVTQTVAPGSDVQIDIIVRNPIQLKRIENIGISVDSPIQIKGISPTCPAYNATISSSINGNTVSFDINGSGSASGGEEKEVLFSLFLHVPTGCADGEYAVKWNVNDTIAYEPNGQAYLPLFRDGRVIVSSKPITTTTLPIPKPINGDANGDGAVLLSDAVFILQSLGNPDKYKIPSSQSEAADVYERGSGITSMDALMIQKFLLKLISSLSAA